MQHIGSRLRELREEKGVSQGKLGRALGIRQSTISQIEVGENMPSLQMLQKLADFFGVQPGYFIDETVEPKHEEEVLAPN